MQTIEEGDDVGDYPTGPDLEGITLHALRHTTASLMRAVGADVKEVQQQLGHRSPVVTLSVYTHLFEGALDLVMERLDDEHRSLAWPRRDRAWPPPEKKRQLI